MSTERVLRLLADLTSGAVLEADGPVPDLAVDREPVGARPPTRPRASARTWRPTPWPDSISGLGPHKIGPYTPCADCSEEPPPDEPDVLWLRDHEGDHVAIPVEQPIGTWCSFGGIALCLRHANVRAAGGGR